MTLTEFLLARIAEDEARVHGINQGECDPDFYWGPDRIRAECAANRRAIQLHTPGSWTTVVEGGEAFDASECPSCWVLLEDPRVVLRPGVPVEDDELVQVPYPCETLRLLALPHADHPDYREEWRP